MTNTGEELSKDDGKYVIFQALSHPARVKILSLIEANDLTFSSLKNNLGMESSGQLQHHLQKLSGFVTEKSNGCYGLTDMGVRALAIYKLSETSGRPLEEVCCIPAPSELAHDKQISISGAALRLSIGLVLTALTVSVVVAYFALGQSALALHLGGSSSVSLGLEGVLIFGFFGVSFLISAATGYPGCEITAIPNLFLAKKMYCLCLITPFNLPNGRLLRRERRSQ